MPSTPSGCGQASSRTRARSWWAPGSGRTGAGPAFRQLAAGYYGADAVELLFAGTALSTSTAIAYGLAVHTRHGDGSGGGSWGGGDASGEGWDGSRRLTPD